MTRLAHGAPVRPIPEQCEIATTMGDTVIHSDRRAAAVLAYAMQEQESGPRLAPSSAIATVGGRWPSFISFTLDLVWWLPSRRTMLGWTVRHG
jgi:hypothetical protein